MTSLDDIRTRAEAVCDDYGLSVESVGLLEGQEEVVVTISGCLITDPRLPEVRSRLEAIPGVSRVLLDIGDGPT